MRHLHSPLLLGLLAGLLCLGGCARFPADATANPAPARTLYSEITVAGAINPTYYYFFALNTAGDPASGPVPVVTGPELGNGWGVLSGIPADQPVQEPPFYVEYHNGRFEQFIGGVPSGQPYRFGVEGARMWVEIDQSLLGAVIPATVQLNWITQERITTPPQGGDLAKEYDGFGAKGREYLDSVQLDIAQIRNSGEGGIFELPYLGVYPDNRLEDSTNIADIDMIGWRVEVKIR